MRARAGTTIARWRRGEVRPRISTLLVIGIVAVALVMRVVDLGVRAMHHDESLHATFSWYFAQGSGYEHDPLMHGPLQFHLIAALFRIFGDSEAMARLPSALAGTALVATPLILRRWLGAAGTVSAALFLALSPVLLYYSRFARNDLLVALFTVLIVAGIWRYRQGGRLRWLLLIAAALALSFASKESTFLTAATLLVYLDVVLWRSLLAQRGTPRSGRVRRWLSAAALLPAAWVIAALWPLLGRMRERLGLGVRPLEADLLIVVGTLTATQLTAAVQLPLTAAGMEVSGETERIVGAAAGIVVLAGVTAVGVLWRPAWWAAVFVVFAAITVPLFTTFFTNPAGFATGFWGSLDYWLEQQGVERGNQPGFYYPMLLPLYEAWLLVPALAGGAWLLLSRRDGRRGDALAGLFAWWFVGTFVALSAAGEKMPWLLVHMSVPLAFLAARAIGVGLPALAARARPPAPSVAAWAAAAILVVAAVGLFANTLRSAVGATYLHPDTPVEPLIYTQTSPDVPRLARRIRAELERGDGADNVVIDTTASLSWPWAWYLRGLPVLYVDPEVIREGNVDSRAILIASEETLVGQQSLRSSYEETVRYHHRWWFPESGYRSTTLRGVAAGLRDGSLIADWMRFLVRRVDRERLGSLDAEALFPGEATAEAGGAAG